VTKNGPYHLLGQCIVQDSEVLYSHTHTFIACGYTYSFMHTVMLYLHSHAIGFQMKLRMFVCGKELRLQVPIDRR